MSGGFLLQAVIYLSAAVVCVPIAKKLGMGSVLGYIGAGILIGPFALGFIGAEGGDIMHFAEFGVVVMLFLIGLELEPARFWSMRRMVFGVGLMQMAGTSVVFLAAGMVLGFTWQTSLAAGLALAMSSTAIVLQSLKERGDLQTPLGQFSFSILLFQDIAVIPILAIIPLLAVTPVMAPGSGHGFLSDLPGWGKGLVVLGAVGLIILAGRMVVVPLLRLVARTRLRELFIASALLIVVSIAFLMEQVGLSPALGTFLAGVVLANSEFKHELESDLDPFKGLLLGLFFIAVGASINFALILDSPSKILILTAGVIVLKSGVILLLGRFNRLPMDVSLSLAVGLSQVGEFAFVLLALLGQVGIVTPHWTDTLMVVTALSMTTTPLLMMANERFLRRSQGITSDEREPDTISERNQVILAGFGHFGSTVGRFLRANGVHATILDSDSSRVELLRSMGFKVFFGDAQRMDLLESAGASEAKILIVAVDSPETNPELVKLIRKHFPNLHLMVRARNRFDAYELLDLGVTDIYRESLDTSVRMGVDVLAKLGHRRYSAMRAGQKFMKYDEDALRELALHRKDMKQYVSRVREQIALQEQLLEEDRQQDPSLDDHAWDSSHVRETLVGG